MEDFPGLLASNYGLRPGGKAAPMAASKGNYGIGSSETRSNSLNRGKSNWNSTPVGNNSSFLDDDNLFRSSNSSSNQRNNNEFDGLGGFNDVYGAPPKHSDNNNGRKTTNLDYDSMFQGINDSNSGAKTNSSLPVYDKPVYDDDIFDGVPGMKSTASVNYDDVFATSSSSPPQQKDRKHTASYDDVFSSFTSPPRRKETSVRNTDDLFTSTSSPAKEKDQFDDLLGNLGRRNTQESRSSTRKGPEVRSRDTSDFDDLLPGFNDRSPAKNRGTPETSHPRQSTVPSNKSTSMSDEPFVIIEPGSVPAHESSEIFRDPLEQFNKADNPDSSYINNSSGGGVFNSMNSFDDFAKSIPSFPSSTKGKMDDTHSLRTGAKTTSTRRAAVEEPAEEPFFRAAKSSSPKVEASPMSEVNVDSAADIWITVSEVPLFTQPTRAPPPSRPPPPRPVQVSKVDDGSRHARNVREKSNEYSSHYSSPGYQNPSAVPSSGSTMGMSSADELEDFARAKEHTDDRPDVLSSEEEVDTNSAAAAMKEAMDRAEAKFKQAREVRERENVRTGRNRDQEKDEKASRDAQERELRERQERLDREREQREKEEKRLDRERREKEREQTRHVVERAQREARERAAMEARQKAQKVAVEKATAEARERAERAAVQRAQNEARERAAAVIKERAEKAAKEAKERAAAEKAASEARERATEARVRATRENQQRNENDLENIFGRPSSTPKPRATAPDFPFDAQPQNRPAPAPGRTSSNPIRKASSTTNIVDDLTSIFGGSPSSGDFPDIDGETEERRRARMERHQRTQERAAKALAEKNERDLQVQRDQAERNRIGESLDIEIKRWSAGKEGNLRALLSTMQYVLWPECGWQPVSLTDLITGASVKKVYRKATLCIHPDKVQQKGANLQQKYIAEKVFDLLKEAWNKFNSEELF